MQHPQAPLAHGLGPPEGAQPDVKGGQQQNGNEQPNDDAARRQLCGYRTPYTGFMVVQINST